MRLKVRVAMPLSTEDLAQLRERGCEEKPFIERESYALFAATGEQEPLRALACVIDVEPMPVYRIGW